MTFLHRHRFVLGVWVIWLVASVLAWPLVGRCVWMGLIAGLLSLGHGVAGFFSNPENFR